MTAGHFFFIPTIFFLGFFIGSTVTNFLSQKKIEKHRIRFTPRSGGSLVASTFVVFIIVFTITHMISFSGGAKSLHATLGHKPLFDQHPSGTAGEVYARLDSFGEAGRTAYKQFTFSGDVIFPLSLLVFLIALAYFVRERTSPSAGLRRILIAVPLIWFLSDMLENSIIYYLISQYPRKIVFLADNLVIITILKFALLLASIALPAISYALFRINSQNDIIEH